MRVRQEFGMIRLLYQDGNIRAINPAQIRSWNYWKDQDEYVIFYMDGYTESITNIGVSTSCWEKFKHDMLGTMSRPSEFE